MGYRGDDLDLRTPQTLSASGAPGRPAYGAGRGTPIPVDETVLAACNHAFDVALAHRAGEVTLDHLLYALTRIDEAVDVLEARGVRVAGLRRETATVVASEIPAVLVNGKASPRRSDELEDTLRVAAQAASRRDAPAGVEDVLRAMVDVRPDLAVVLQPQRVPPRYSGAYYDLPPPRAYEAERARAGYAVSEARAVRGDAIRSDLSPTDTIQNSRLEALEQMVRALSNDLASERKVFSGVLQDMQREVMAQRDDMTRFSGAVPERVTSEITDRMQGLERAMMSSRLPAVDLGPVLDRLAALEQAITSREAPKVDLGPIASRLDLIEEAVLSHEPSVLMGLNNRLKAVEDGLVADRAQGAEAHQTLMAEVGSLSASVAALATELKAAASSQEAVGDRLDKLTEAVAGSNTQAERWLEGVDTKLGLIETGARAAADLADQRQASHAQDLKELHEALVKLSDNQHALSSSIGDWWRDSAAQVSEVAAKVSRLGNTAEGLELNLGSMGNGLSGFGRSLMDVDARIGGIDGSLSALAGRLDRIEKEAGKPVAMLESVSGTLDNMHRVTVERYYRRNRFWYWLFGTDDWVAASWPSQAARIVGDLKAVRAAKK